MTDGAGPDPADVRSGGERPAPSVVMFDLDDTLFAHRDAVDRGILSHLRALGGPYAGADAAATVTLWHALEEEHYHSYLAGALDFQGQRRARARDFAAAHGVRLGDDEAAAWYEAYFAHYESGWRLHDDVDAGLASLEAAYPGVRFGLITNAGFHSQLQKLRFTGLVDRLEHIIASESAGFAKPDPRIFSYACQVFGVTPADAVYVGDRLRTDAIGAASAGLTGVWLDRRAAEMADADRAEAARLGVLRVTDLRSLPVALARRLPFPATP
jgi:putative hydrolase of the HAD superfamily